MNKYIIRIEGTKFQYAADTFFDVAEQYIAITALMPGYKGFVYVLENGYEINMTTRLNALRELVG